MSETRWEQIRRLEPLRSDTVQIVQITDCHIFANPDESLRGMNTRHAFEAVKNAVLASDDGCDLLLATGDLAQDGSAGAYRYLANQFDSFGAPVFWLPGNHDDIDVMQQNFVGKHIQAARQVLAGNWLIVMLDSTIAGEVHGRVCASQIDFMDNTLRRHASQHALVCLHHQARQTGSEWIDQKGLLDADQLRARLARHDNVRAVLWGHVHQEFHQSIDGVEWLSTPSSCVQFKPGSKDFALDDANPGFRRLKLGADGGIDTSVFRIEL